MSDLAQCPYLHGGTCVSGCHSEPRCLTEAPVDGWEAPLLRSELNRMVDVIQEASEEPWAEHVAPDYRLLHPDVPESEVPF